VLSSGTIRLLAATYFLVEFIRYTLLFWLPLFLSQYHRLEAGAAGYVSGLFDVAGLGGVIGAGYLSDRIFSSRRSLVASIMMIALAGISLLATGTPKNMFATALTVAFMGALTYGPDTLARGSSNTGREFGEERRRGGRHR
jgi:sugar phosphate permease